MCSQLITAGRATALFAMALSVCFGFSEATNPDPNFQATGTGGTVQGTVKDQSGAPIPKARVTLINGLTSFNAQTDTAEDGSYRFANVPLNTYTLRVAAPGFQSFSQAAAIHTSVPMVIDASLTIAADKETVEVQATADSVENEPSGHTDVSSSMLTNLPIANTGQGLSDAITLATGGVVADSNGFFHPQGDHGETTYVVDGQSISDQQSKTFSTQLPPNAFQSMELVTSSPSAEFGDKTSLVVNAVTRSGLGQKTTASLDTHYGSFGSYGEDATYGVGGSMFGNYLVVDTSGSGRFLDGPEFYPNHDHGNNETIFDRIDYQPNGSNSLHLDIFGARNWFQIPNTYDEAGQDQRQQAKTFSFSLGFQHTFSPHLLLTVSPYVRQDRIGYYPSRDPFEDTPATVSQDRHLTNWGTSANLAYANSVHNVKIGMEVKQTRLAENFALGITDPAFNAVCLTAGGDAVTNTAILDTAQCASYGYLPNNNLSPGLGLYDLTRGGHLFEFHSRANVNQQVGYAQDSISLKNLTINLGVRFDNYDGITSDNLFQPRVGLSYLVKKTGTVLRASYTRAMETPYNENLLLSSTTGAGGLASNVFGAFGSTPLRPGHRNQESVGLQQNIGRFLQVDANYFWKITQNAFDFDTLFNTSIAFPIEWRQSKIDGVSGRISTTSWHGFQAYTTMGHTRARFFGPENGGLVFNSPLDTGVFRIDHDQAFQQTTFLRYQHGKEGVWAMLTWRFDSGEVAGSVTDLNDALALTGDQQYVIGFHCGSQYATPQNPITSCTGNYGAVRIDIPAPGTFDPDHNPPRIAPRNLFDAGIGTDNLFHSERIKTKLKFTALNITNREALYNFLSTFSGTHFVTPRSYEVSLGWAFN